MSKINIREVLTRKLMGLSQPQDQETIDKWIQEDPKNKKLLEVFLESNASDESGHFESERVFNRLQKRIDKDSQKRARMRVLPKRTPASYWLRVAAVIAIVMLSAVAGWFVQNSGGEEVAILKMKKENPMGQKSTHFLSDGTKVVLNSGSSIEYSQPFSDNRREVSLEGEAYFEVAKDPDRPFLVHTKSLATKALGTAFNINAFQDKIKVSLTEGKVLVTDSKAKVRSILRPGEEIAYSQQSGEYDIGSFESERTVAWKDGILVLHNADFDEVKAKLEKWYGVTIRADEEQFANWSVNGEFDNQSLEYVLRSLSFTKDFVFTIDSQKVTITPD